MEYLKAIELFNKCRDKSKGSKLENNTYLVKTEKGYGVKLHATVVVEILDNGTYRLNSGGWYTPTTKARINYYAPVRLTQSKYRWYIGGHDYSDNMVVDCLGIPLKKFQGKTDKKRDKLLKDIKAYIDGYGKLIEAGKLELPSVGDCWACGMKTENNPDPFGYDHYLLHFKEKYYVPSLLLKALRSRGYDDYFFKIIMDKKDFKLAKQVLRSFFQKIIPMLLEE